MPHGHDTALPRRRAHAHCHDYGKTRTSTRTHAELTVVLSSNTLSTRVEGLERLRFSLARQNANGLHYLLH